MKSNSRTSARGALTSLALCILLSSLGTSIANVALPALTEAFAVPFEAVQGVVVAYLAAITLSLAGAGKLGDLAGRRRMLLAGIAIFVFASLLCGAAGSLGLLIAARAAQGLGAALMMALGMALAGESLPAERTGGALGLLGTVSAIGTALGPSLGGLLIAGLGWRAIFLVNLPLGLAAYYFAWRHLPRSAAPAAEAPAAPARRGLPGDLPLAGRLAAGALVAMVMMATLVVGPFYLGRALGLGTAKVGLVMTAGPLAAALAGYPAGRLVDRFGHRKLAISGLAGIAAGSALLAILPRAAGVAGYLLPIVLVTVFYSAFQAANNTAVLTAVDPARRGTASGLLNLSRNLGLILGASILGAVFSLGSGSADVSQAAPEAVASGMRATFAVAALLMAAAGIFMGPRGAGMAPAVTKACRG